MTRRRWMLSYQPVGMLTQLRGLVSGFIWRAAAYHPDACQWSTGLTGRCAGLAWRLRAKSMLLLLLLSGVPANAEPVTLHRGVNITNWFRYPPSRDPAVLARYLSDQALSDLHTAGFDFIRVAIDPDIVSGRQQGAVLVEAIRRIEAHGMAVVVSPHPHGWQLESVAADRERLLAFWQELAPKLAVLDQTRTLPEVLNEPVFPGSPKEWALLQQLILINIRQSLPRATVVLTGQDWGSIGGLLALTPVPDPNVLYTFHFYDPSELTSLAAYRRDVDHMALRRLPFPVDDPSGCDASAGTIADSETRGLMLYYCGFGWDESRIGATIDRAAQWAHRYGVRLLAGEFGASSQLNTAARLAWLETTSLAFDDRQIAWALWGYDDSMGFAVAPGVRPVLDPAILSALGLAAAN